jgi:hypothetical protein
VAYSSVWVLYRIDSLSFTNHQRYRLLFACYSATVFQVEPQGLMSGAKQTARRNQRHEENKEMTSILGEKRCMGNCSVCGKPLTEVDREQVEQTMFFACNGCRVETHPQTGAEILLAKAQELQTQFWDVLKELEDETGLEIDSTQDLQGWTVSSLKDAAGVDDSDDEQEIPTCEACGCTDGTCQHAS